MAVACLKYQRVKRVQAIHNVKVLRVKEVDVVESKLESKISVCVPHAHPIQKVGATRVFQDTLVPR